jgi:hypothetical protein
MRACSFFIDPKAELDSAKNDGMPVTLVEYEELHAFAQMALKLNSEYKKQNNQNS